MATKKSGGSSCNGRDSAGRRHGLKRADGQIIKAGNIIVTQLGTKISPGRNVGMGRNHTLFAKIQGKLSFKVGKRSLLYAHVTE
ncbi:MAG: 50S ribosomal protein L27, partial [Anaplasmataceae bacterium]|nr:50S ribosomal protein L27 [Anaplasmataceae bacterium]